jgi:hypothetical protein
LKKDSIPKRDMTAFAAFDHNRVALSLLAR